MNLKVKKGADLISTLFFDKKGFILNLKYKYTYESFIQIKELLIINTKKGTIILVFAGDIFNVNFESENKDQLIFICKN